MYREILYSVVVKSSNGGQRMNSFLNKNSAINNSKEVINHIAKNDVVGVEVYLSELEYDYRKNLLLADKLINNESELLFQN